MPGEGSAPAYASADALAEDLTHWLAGEPIAARAATTLERTAKWARRKPTLAAAYVLGLLAAILGGLGGSAVWMWSATENPRGPKPNNNGIARTVPETRPMRPETRRGRPEPTPNNSEISSSDWNTAARHRGSPPGVA